MATAAASAWLRQANASAPSGKRPDHELRRQHLAEQREGERRGEARQHELARRATRPAPPAGATRPTMDPASSDDTAPLASCSSAVRAVARHAHRVAHADRVQPEQTIAGELSICTGRSRW